MLLMMLKCVIYDAEINVIYDAEINFIYNAGMNVIYGAMINIIYDASWVEHVNCKIEQIWRNCY